MDRWSLHREPSDEIFRFVVFFISQNIHSGFKIIRVISKQFHTFSRHQKIALWKLKYIYITTKEQFNSVFCRLIKRKKKIYENFFVVFSQIYQRRFETLLYICGVDTNHIFPWLGKKSLFPYPVTAVSQPDIVVQVVLS